ncbi:MAG: ACT domain-containing protein [Desulfobulbaceae bacterium]|nr:ACT domain-containing protein [Desulfobulbaceae bacterium]
MQVEQIAVFLENKSGRLAEITSILAENDINIRALSVADTADFGILRLIVNDVTKAQAVLKKGGFTVSKTDVIAVAVPDRVGGLAEVLRAVTEGGYNVEYMYAYAHRADGSAVMIFRFDAMADAVAMLKDKGFALVSSREICAT